MTERLKKYLPRCRGEEKAESKDVVVQRHSHFYMPRLSHFSGDTSSLLVWGTGVYSFSILILVSAVGIIHWSPEFVEFLTLIKKIGPSPKILQEYVQEINEGQEMKAANDHRLSALYWNPWRYLMQKIRRKLQKGSSRVWVWPWKMWWYLPPPQKYHC